MHKLEKSRAQKQFYFKKIQKGLVILLTFIVDIAKNFCLFLTDFAIQHLKIVQLF